MAAWVCAACSAVYTVGAPACPHCGDPAAYEEGDVAKINVRGGASNADNEPGGGATPSLPPESPAPGAGVVSPAQEATPQAAVPERPAQSAPKPDWVAYVTASGVGAQEAGGMTKADLIAWQPPPAGSQVTATAVVDAQVTHPDGSVS